MTKTKSLKTFALAVMTLMCFSMNASQRIQAASPGAEFPAYQSPWFVFFLVVLAIGLLTAFFRNYTGLRIKYFESFTSRSELILKIKTLSILSIVLFPFAEYYEGVYLKVYPPSWMPISVIFILSCVTLLFISKKNLSFDTLNSILRVSYAAIYGIIIYKSFAAGMLPVMAIEAACLMLFSKLVFTKLKTFSYFLIYVVLIDAFCIGHFQINEMSLDIHLSASIEAAVVSIALYVIEGYFNRKVAFGSKILETSNLYILVADSKASFVFVNHYLEQTTGLSQDEILQGGWWEYLGQGEAKTEELKSFITDSIKNNKNSQTENTIRDANGEIIHVQWENTVIDNEYLLAVGKNVTLAKRLREEEAIRTEKTRKYSQTINALTTIPYSRNYNLHSALKNILKNASDIIEVERVGIWNYENKKIVCELQYSSLTSEFQFGETLNEKDYPSYFAAIGSGQVVNAPDVSVSIETQEFQESYFKHHNIKSMLDVPIFIQGKLDGVLCFEKQRVIRQWDNEDVAFARAVAHFVALSIEAHKRQDIEQEYGYILNNAGDIIYTTDSLGNFDFINKTTAEFLGYEIKNLKGVHFSSIVYNEDRDHVIQFYLDQFRDRVDSTYYEFRVNSASGQTYWVGQNVRLLLDGNSSDHIVGFQSVARDITKQKEIELALIKSENNFRQINENINEVFYLYNFESKKYDYVSPNSKSILGVDPSFFYEGNNFYTVHVLDEDQAEIEHVNNNGPNKKLYDIEFRINCNGQIRSVRERSYPITDEAGRVVKKSGVLADITEKKLQEQQLKQLSKVAESVSNGVVITSASGLIEWCNQSFLDLMEYSLDELLGKRPIEIFSGPDTQAQVVSSIKETKLENSSVEVLQYSKSGVAKWLLITNTSLTNDKGQVEKYLEIVTDLTAKKKLEQEYKQLIENAGDIIYSTDEIGNVNFINESITTNLGYEPSELLGLHFSHIIHPDDKKRVVLFYLKQFSQQTNKTYSEFRVFDKKGVIRWVGQNVKIIFDGTNTKIKGFQSVLRDITKQKESEEALTISESNFRQISETVNDVFYLYDFNKKRYAYMSPKSGEIIGVPSQYFLEGNDFLEDYVHIKDKEKVAKVYEGTRRGEPFYIDYRIVVNHAIKWVREKAFIIKDEQGAISKISGIYTDITSSKIQERKLLKANKTLSSYSEDLEINNLLNQQLIYSNTIEDISKVILNTLKDKISDVEHGTLLLLNHNNTGFDAYHVEDDSVKRSIYDFTDIKAYPHLLKGEVFIEDNMTTIKEAPKYIIHHEKENIVSYIAMPISYSGTFYGALLLAFGVPYNLSKRETDVLDNFTAALSAVINKLTLQTELSEKNKDIIASLNYAYSLQQSILPNISLHGDVINNFMKFYQPKDVVSGDFYVIEAFNEYTMIALGDCTGHGVPGAFITMIGSNFLQRAFSENNMKSPAEILEYLDKHLYYTLNKNREKAIRDGMEIGICVYNNKTKELTFAAAGIFLVYYRDNEQVIVSGSKRSIGDQNHDRIDFAETKISLNGTEKFYLFSDGYRDQLGGADKRKRFSRAKFFELLHRIKNLPSFQQEFMLKSEFNKHKGKYEQTDDISVIGFELK